MSTINKVILIGNVGKEPEARYMPDGRAVTTISLATSFVYKDKNTGEKKEETEWHRVVGFERIAEVMSEYLYVGSKVYFEGRMRTRKWKDKNEVERYTTEVVATRITLLESRKESEGKRGAKPEGAASKPARTPGKFDDMEDDIPF